MKTFDYTAINSEAKTVTGQIEEESVATAIRKIRAMGLHPTQVEESPQAISGVPSTDTNEEGSEPISFPGESLHLKKLLAQRAKNAERYFAWKKLGTLLQCGVPIIQAIKITRGGVEHKMNQALFDQVYRNVNQGESICVSLEGHVSDLELAVLYVGEGTGTLPKTLLKITDVDTGLLEDDCEFVIANLLPPMLEAGLPLLMCLRVLANSFKDKTILKIGEIAKELVRQIEEGNTFYEALSQRPDVFTKFFINAVKAGELGGVLETALRHIKDYIFDAYKRNGLVP